MTEEKDMPQPNPKPTIVDLEAIRRQVVERAGEESREKPGGGSGGGGVTGKFVMNCYYANELGDGVLYARIHMDKFVYVKKMGQWLAWGGHHWVIDVMDRHKAVVEAVVEAYESEARRLGDEIAAAGQDKNTANALQKAQDGMFARVRDLRTRKRRNNILDYAHSCDVALAIEGDEIDTNPWLLPCSNGVINLKTGELEAGRPRDYLLKACPVEWRGIDTPCETWEQALLDMMDDDPEMVAFLQRLFGYAMVGEVLHSIIIVMTGKGRNGKSTIVEIMGEVLGPLAGAVRSEMLLDQSRIQSSRGPTPDIMALKGLRVAFASETDDGCRVSPSRVKWLTGKDTLAGRNPHDKYEQQFKPSHTLFLLTNHKPHAPADDFAFWERVVLVPFNLSFVDRPPRDGTDERRADPHLYAKLKEELPGILAWMVKGCLIWQEMGLAPPIKVKEAISEYQRDEDIIADFADACLIMDEDEWVTATQLYVVFEIWWKANVNNTPPKQKRFGTLMGRRFEKKKDGVVKYFGIRLSPDGQEMLAGAANNFGR